MIAPHGKILILLLAAIAMGRMAAAQTLPEWLGQSELAGRGVHVAEIIPVDGTRLIAGLSNGEFAGLQMQPSGALMELWRIGPNARQRLTGLATGDGVIGETQYNDGIVFHAGDGTTTPTISGSQSWSPGVALGVAMLDGVAYIAAGFEGIRMAEYLPDLPDVMDLPASGFVERIRLFGNTLIIGEGRGGLTMIRVDGPGQLSPLGSLLISGRVEDFALMDDYLAVAAGSDGLLLYDVSNPAAPVALDWRSDWSSSRVEVFDGGFVSGGWVLASWGIGADSKLTPRAQVMAGGSVASLAVMGGRVLAGNFEGAVNVFELAGRATPQPVFQFNTNRFTELVDFNAHWIVGTGPRSRLWFFEWNENSQSATFLHDEPAHSITKLMLDGDTVWSADADRALQQWTFNSAANKFQETWIDTGRPGNAIDFERDGDRLYVSARSFGWRVYSLADESAPALIAESGSPVSPDQIAMGGGRLYTRNQFQGVRAFTLDDPLAPQPRGTVFPWLPFHVSARGDYVFLSRRRYGMEIWNFSNPDAPQFAGAVPLFDARMTLPINGQYILAAEGVMGATVIDWSNPSAPRLVCRIPAVDGAPVQWLHRSDNRIAVASGTQLAFWPTGEIFQSMEFEGDLWMIR